MQPLLIVTAAIELGAGVALLAVPSLAAQLLLGTPLDSPVAFTLARVAGGAILALGIACWLGRRDVASPAARGLVMGMLVYNVVAAAVLAYAGVAWKLNGVLLWPGVVLHAGMAVWCVRAGAHSARADVAH
jgi:hypothetical protein